MTDPETIQTIFFPPYRCGPDPRPIYPVHDWFVAYYRCIQTRLGPDFPLFVFKTCWFCRISDKIHSLNGSILLTVFDCLWTVN